MPRTVQAKDEAIHGHAGPTARGQCVIHPCQLLCEPVMVAEVQAVYGDDAVPPLPVSIPPQRVHVFVAPARMRIYAVRVGIVALEPVDATTDVQCWVLGQLHRVPEVEGHTCGASPHLPLPGSLCELRLGLLRLVFAPVIHSRGLAPSVTPGPIRRIPLRELVQGGVTEELHNQ